MATSQVEGSDAGDALVIWNRHTREKRLQNICKSGHKGSLVSSESHLVSVNLCFLIDKMRMMVCTEEGYCEE